MCYEGAHLEALVFGYLLLLGYGIGFPLLSVYLLYRAFHKPAAATYLVSGDDPRAVGDAQLSENQQLAARQAREDAKRADFYGWMYRGLIPTAYYFRLTTFITNWGQ